MKEIIVHKFTMGDVEDPQIYIAEPLWNWENSEQGKWVVEHAEEAPYWQLYPDSSWMGHKCVITAKFTEKKISEFYLRWGKV